MDDGRRRLLRGFYALGLVGSALYFTLFGYVLNARGQTQLALLAAMAALTLALLLLREALPQQADG